MNGTYVYIVTLTKDDGVTRFKVAITAADDNGLRDRIAEAYPDHDWYSPVGERYQLV
jgi:hypothetical protein